MSSQYQKRREKLSELMGNDGACLIFNPGPFQRSADTCFRYRASSHFVYLANLSQENTALLLIAGETPKFYLFTTPNNEMRALWEGELPSFEKLKQDHHADEVYDISKIEEILPELIEDQTTLWIDLHNDKKAMTAFEAINRSRQLAIRKGASPIKGIQDAGLLISELRLIKDEEDLRLMKQAAHITKVAHIESLKACRPGMNECEIEGLIDFTFKRLGGTCPAYTSIVGGGSNACVLHYIDNQDPLKDGDLLLIDAGVEYQNYASDVTRTFPVNGKFTEPQREIYELVLKSQLKAIETAKVGYSFTDVHKAACLVLTEGLVELNLLKGDPKELINSPEFRRYYPHNTGHWMGIDVHDVGLYQMDGNSRKLEPGMVLTVEPGLYFSPKFDEVPEKYRGIGIRIEDDVLVTTAEPEVLTDGIPKTIKEIESTMKESSFYPHNDKTLKA